MFITAEEAQNNFRMLFLTKFHTSHYNLQNDAPLILSAHYDSGHEKVECEITIRLIKDVHRTETGYLQVIRNTHTHIMYNGNFFV